MPSCIYTSLLCCMELCCNFFLFFCRYVVHRLLICALGRRAEDDRDHYANKRLDLAGSLLGGLFRMVLLLVLNTVSLHYWIAQRSFIF